MSESQESPNPRRKLIGRVLLLGIAFVVGFLVLGAPAIGVWDYSNGPAFCADICHEVHPEEIPAYQDSYHARVQCTECHMGRVSTLQNIFLKLGHIRNVPEALFGLYDRPVESKSLRPTSESCERCHWAPAHQGDHVLELTRYLPDEGNTEKRTYLILNIGGGEKDLLRSGMGYGIHWHALNQVEYIATDELRQEIPWVRATLPNGQRVEYNDVAQALSPEEIAEAEIRVMDCVDCHNRVGHPFPPPGRAVDKALTDGRLAKDLPFIRQEMVDLLTGDYGSQEEASVATEKWKAQYQASYPYSSAAEIDEAAVVAEELFTSLVFKRPGVTWQSFPDHGEHRESPGCFRCHDGKHLSPEGESIRLHCNICHSIPVTIDPGDNPPRVPAAALREPASHLEANFLADHRFQASDDCVECHGEVAFGSDDSSFCADSSCHGEAWPMVKLDAAFPHPVELEGKHTEVWCHDCHEGVEKPDLRCSNCHKPPMEPHFGTQCEDCHTPESFAEADAGDFEHPLALEGAHAMLACSDCHVTGQELAPDCAACHQPPSEPHFGEVCQDCHTPEGFDKVDVAGFEHPVALEGAHADLTCASCHAAGQELTYDCAECHQPPSQPHYGTACQDCHTPEGFKDVEGDAIAVDHPVALEGAHAELACSNCHTGEQPLTYDCGECHQPPSQPHYGTACQDCHTPEGFDKADVSGFEHPVALEGAHADLTCASCHAAGQELTYDCAECHQPPSQPHYGTACQDCHSPSGFEQVDLRGFEHPVALVGSHAVLACADCHTSGKDLTYNCAECHNPPSEPHFGAACQDCHTPTGFEDVEPATTVHPVALEGAHASLACSKCHTGDQPLTNECAECHDPPSEPHFGTACQDCHTPAGFEDVEPSAAEHPVALEGAHASLECSKCHNGDQPLTYECAACHEPPGEGHFTSGCQNCHTPEGWSESAEHLEGEAEEIPHEVEGRDDCLLCHDPEGQVKPAPSSHSTYVNEQCKLCHKTESD